MRTHAPRSVPGRSRTAVASARSAPAVDDREVYEAHGTPGLILLQSSHPAMRRSVAIARQVAASDAPVLLQGESGTGKSLLAAAIHGWSARHAGPFVTVHGATLTDWPTIVKSRRGARDGVSRLSEATGGTLFLNEVGDVALDVQGRLLRTLPTLEFDGVGGGSLDVRLIAATQRDLDAEVAAGRFREDLFFRLNVVTIVLPPLRERVGDLPALVENILARVAVRHEGRVVRVAPEVYDILAAYRWPGNLRELTNTLERAVILSTDDTITAADLPDRVLGTEDQTDVETGRTSLSLEEVERLQIERVLADSQTLEEAATRLGINPVTLWRKRKRYGLE